MSEAFRPRFSSSAPRRRLGPSATLKVDRRGPKCSAGRIDDEDLWATVADSLLDTGWHRPRVRSARRARPECCRHPRGCRGATATSRSGRSRAVLRPLPAGVLGPPTGPAPKRQNISKRLREALVEFGAPPRRDRAEQLEEARSHLRRQRGSTEQELLEQLARDEIPTVLSQQRGRLPVPSVPGHIMESLGCRQGPSPTSGHCSIVSRR